MPSFLTYVKKGRNCFFKFKAGLFFRFPLYFGYDFPSLPLVIITRSGFYIHQGKVTKLSTRKVWSLKSQAHEPNRSEYCSPLETGILCSVELSKWAKVRLSRGQETNFYLGTSAHLKPQERASFRTIEIYSSCYYKKNKCSSKDKQLMSQPQLLALFSFCSKSQD